MHKLPGVGKEDEHIYEYRIGGEHVHSIKIIAIDSREDKEDSQTNMPSLLAIIEHKMFCKGSKR